MEANNNIPSILFLHGFGQSGEIFDHRLKSLTKKIKKKFNNKINYIFPDAPILLEEKTDKGEIERGWMRCDDPEHFYELESCKYLGLKESIDEIFKLGDNNPSVQCIFTFSQGTSVLFYSILLDLYAHNNYDFLKHFPNLKCLVLVSGFVKPYPENEEFKDFIGDIKSDKNIKQFEIPSLHVFGNNDPFVKCDRSKEATKFFKDPVIFAHEGKHFVPSSKDDCPKYEDFLIKYINISK